MSVGIITLIWLVGDLSAPSRRHLQNYHKSWLDSPDNHSIHYEKKGSGFSYLVVEPKGVAPSERGKVLRQQLADRGIASDRFGSMNQHLIILHGRKGRKEDMLPIAERYCAIGYRCILPDLPAHGESSEERAYFGTLGEELFSLISMIFSEEHDKGFLRKPIIFGISMGGSYASHLVSRYEELFEKCLLVCTFDTLQNVIDNKCGSENLGRLVNGISISFFGFEIEKANSVKQLNEVRIPLFMAHGTRDKVIPFELGRSLYDSLKGEKQWVTVDGANHNNIFITEHQLFADAAEFMMSN